MKRIHLLILVLLLLGCLMPRVSKANPVLANLGISALVSTVTYVVVHKGIHADTVDSVLFSIFAGTLAALVNQQMINLEPPGYGERLPILPACAAGVVGASAVMFTFQLMHF